MPLFKIKDIADEISVRVDDPKTSGYDIFVGLEHYDSGKPMITRYGSTSKLDSSAKVFESGDILIARRNVYLKRAGLVQFKGLTSGDSIVIRAKNENIQKLLPFIFNTTKFWDYASKHADGSMSKRLSPKNLMEFEVNLPSNDAELEQLSSLLWSMYDSMRSYEDVIAKSDDLIKSQFIEMFGDSSSNVWRNISDVAEVLAGGDKPIDYSETKTPDYCYPVFANGIDNEGLQCFAKDYRVGESAVTISARGTIGATFIRKPFFTPIVRLITIIPGKKVDVTYLKYAIDSIGVSSNGSSQQQLTVPNVKKMVVPVPKISEQKKYTTFVEQIDKSKFEIEKLLNEITKLYQKIIKDCLKA